KKEKRKGSEGESHRKRRLKKKKIWQEGHLARVGLQMRGHNSTKMEKMTIKAVNLRGADGGDRSPTK
ncbi:hypothetical protein LINPERHAP1_LOCUS15325, partial [Linum perenne]